MPSREVDFARSDVFRTFSAWQGLHERSLGQALDLSSFLHRNVRSIRWTPGNANTRSLAPGFTRTSKRNVWLAVSMGQR